ncbi:YHS domain-containing protein [Flavobacterium sp. ANB]|uniref:YHS domain-containing (seleno)protein n=1 Tax=unclassified Flavobacterium TaxID=196869 RepID=UPI0012B9D1D4|nr:MULTISPECIES: YHS domain-containing (seleno)protein [unclassified Flavobacterium]MBF4517748.1 YHS domain-containing protein [Flavobacterium sp. ANB]MTD70475.1 YHS domain-containing protein [Flavobacterium sp. LC2016-13]
MKKLVLLLLILVSGISFAQNDAKRVSQYNLENKIAIQGYDPVGYFNQGKAIKGKKEISVSYQGVIYNFSSNENKNAFLKNPSKYEPQYGGWCAYAMGSANEKVEINPETFKIVDGKLFLFYNAYFNNTLKSWNKDESNLKTQADNNWKKIYK